MEWGKKIAQERNLKILDTFVDEKTGTKPGRPAFNDMMVRMQQGEAEGILVWKLDRLARNPIDEGSPWPPLPQVHPPLEYARSFATITILPKASKPLPIKLISLTGEVSFPSSIK